MNKRRVLVLLIILALITLFFCLDLGRYLTLESLKANRDSLLRFYAAHRSATILGFILVYVLQTALSLPGATVLSLAAGAVFGAIQATIYVNIGATLGATVAFLLARYLLRDPLQRRFETRLERINSELEKAGFNYLLFLRLVPIFPFFLINLAAGMTTMPLRTFFWGTLIGIIPGSFVYCNAGASLAAINRIGEIASPRALGSFVLLGLFAIVPAFYKKLKRKKRVSG
jgi:uncharacterized membrane protein YdjX (TVP38/TMEM64 family)